MNKKTKNSKVVPKLRFPEFWESGEWEVKILGDNSISKFVNEKTPTNELNIETYISTENLLANFEGVKKAEKLPKTGSFTTYRKEDILIANIRPYLKKVWFSDKYGAASNDVIVIRAGFNIEASFLLFIIKNDKFISYVMKGAKGVKMPRGDKSLMKKYLVPIPSLKEQQKIANCLSSLDEVIQGESDKLEALQAHKKGLLQQLFPKDEAVVPAVRFEEFVGDWEMKKLGKIANNLDAKRVPITKGNREKGKIPYYGASGIIDYVKDFLFDEELLLISEDGANLVARVYPIAFSISGKTWVNNHAHVLKFKENATQILVENYLNSISLEEFLTGMAQPKLSKSKLNIIPIPLPKLKEQKKIANCLISLDDLITAQGEKVEALKQHKKGLMQQLFPDINE